MHLIHQGGPMYRFMNDILKNALVSAITNSVSITCNKKLLFGKWKPFYLLIFNEFHEIRILRKTKFTSIYLLIWAKYYLIIRGGGYVFFRNVFVFFIRDKDQFTCAWTWKLVVFLKVHLHLLLKTAGSDYLCCVSFRSRCFFFMKFGDIFWKKSQNNIAPTTKIKPLIEKWRTHL